jgi:hypothetical protein
MLVIVLWLILTIMAIEDWLFRSVRVLWFLLLAVLLLFKPVNEETLLLGGFFLFLIFGLSFIVLSLRSRSFYLTNFLGFIGIGDLSFQVVLLFLFEPLDFLFFFVFSLILSLLLNYLVQKVIFSNKATVPLITYQVIAYFIWELLGVNVNSEWILSI